MAKWSKSKAQTETKLPPLTTEQTGGTDWHRKSTVADTAAIPPWRVTWDTSRHPDAFNTAYQKTEEEAMDCARRFSKLGFLVYSIQNSAGVEVMDEAAIAERFKAETHGA